jgi:hypothetical protein
MFAVLETTAVTYTFQSTDLIIVPLDLCVRETYSFALRKGYIIEIRMFKQHSEENMWI